MSLSDLYEQLRVKQEQLNRLQVCEGKLQQNLLDFSDNYRLCQEPALTPETWAGERANEFEKIRENEIATSYGEIMGTQFSSVFNALSDKMTSLENEIIGLKAAIAAMEAAMAAEAAAALNK